VDEAGSLPRHTRQVFGGARIAAVIIFRRQRLEYAGYVDDGMRAARRFGQAFAGCQITGDGFHAAWQRRFALSRFGSNQGAYGLAGIG
jgi:hypothetical protein